MAHVCWAVVKEAQDMDDGEFGWLQGECLQVFPGNSDVAVFK